MGVEQDLLRLDLLSLPDLYGELYRATDEGEGFLGAPALANKEGEKMFVTRYRDRLVNLVCETWDGCNKAEAFGGDAVQLGSAIAAAAAGVFPPALIVPIAAIATKIGINALCNCAHP